jgi:protein involved in polysaccharide export with SLBB domain
LRILRHFRGKELIQEVDVYELLLHGVRSGVERLQAGDTILVPPLGPEVTVEGMVRRPAVYELKGEKSLAEILEIAGGVLSSGTLRHVDVERVEAHLSRTMLRLDIPENNGQEAVNQSLSDFQIQDGDRIKISPILPYADKTVYLDGHVFRPGKFAYREGMKVTDLIKSYNDLLPEPYKQHAEIIRLTPPDYTPAVISFNLGDALAGKEQDVALKPFDTVRIFGRFDFEDPPIITVSGEVRDPGDHVTNGVTYLKDAVYLAGGTTPDALLADAQVFRRTDDGKLKVLSVNLGKALSGDQADNLLLQAKDRIFIHKNLSKVDPATVTVEGEVARPGIYPLGSEMNATDLIRLAGGLKRGAYTQSADLTRYLVEDGKKMVGEHMTLPIAAALSGEPDTDVRLRDGDVLTIGELAGWKDVGATITVRGEVLHPGIYGIREGETLSSVIARAGGFRADAYPYGSIFERTQIREIEEKNRAELIRQVQDEGTTLKLVTSTDPDEKLAKDASLLQWKATMEALQKTPPSGRLVIHISADTKRWSNSSSDIPVRAGDVIYIPKKPTFVMVDGSVYNPTAVSFRPGKSAGWYLRQAGGPNNMANKKAIFVIRADGSVTGGDGGLFSGGVEDAELRPGDMVVVPQKAFSGTTRWKNTLQVAQLVSAVGIAVQVARGF